MATVFECDRCKTLDRGPSHGSARREITIGERSLVVCGECAIAVLLFADRPMPDAAATCNATRLILARNLLEDLSGEGAARPQWWVASVKRALQKLGALPVDLVEPDE